MNLYKLRSLYRPRSLKPFLGVLDELEYKFSNEPDAYKIVRDFIERNMYPNAADWNADLLESNNPRVNVYFAINNVSFGYL